MSYKCGHEKYQQQAYDVMMREMKGIDDRDSWIPVLIRDLTDQQKAKIIQAIALIAEKFKIKDNELELILKGRLCADGRREDISMFLEGDLAAPTVQILALFSMLSVAAAKNFNIMTFDIGQAFLNADIENEVYVRLDQRLAEMLIMIKPDYKKFQNKNGTLVLKLLKALYGTKEAAKLWYNHFRDILESYGYVKSELDQCVFHKINDEEKASIMIHVDDGIVLAENVKELDLLLQNLNGSFEGKFTHTLGKIHKYLGMRITQYNGYVIVDMTTYIDDICTEYDVHGMRKVPADTDLFSIDPSLPLLHENIRKKFHSGVHKILFLATRVRPDILCATIFLTRRVKVTTLQDWQKFMNVLKYLNFSRLYGLCLGGDENGIIHLEAYADAAHAVNTNMTSQTGLFATLGRGSAYSKSTAQHSVARSSMEAECYSLSDIIPIAVWIQDFISEAGYAEYVNPGTLHEDNLSLIYAIRKGDISSDRTRHIRIRKLFTKEFIENGKFQLEHCPTESMIADILTKPLQGALFERLRDLILGYTTRTKQTQV